MPIVVMVFGIIEVSIQKPDRLEFRNFKHNEGRSQEGRRTRQINFPIISDNESQHRRYISDNTGFTFKPLNENDTISKDFIDTMEKMVNSSSKSNDQNATTSSPKRVQNQKHCNGGARSPHKTTTNKPTVLPRSFKSDFKAPKAGLVSKIFHLSLSLNLLISVNYTKHFPPVKNQGSCQSCWVGFLTLCRFIFATNLYLTFFRLSQRFLYSSIECLKPERMFHILSRILSTAAP